MGHPPLGSRWPGRLLRCAPTRRSLRAATVTTGVGFALCVLAVGGSGALPRGVQTSTYTDDCVREDQGAIEGYVDPVEARCVDGHHRQEVWRRRPHRALQGERTARGTASGDSEQTPRTWPSGDPLHAGISPPLHVVPMSHVAVQRRLCSACPHAVCLYAVLPALKKALPSAAHADFLLDAVIAVMRRYPCDEGVLHVAGVATRYHGAGVRGCIVLLCAG